MLQTLRDYWLLTRPRIVALVLFLVVRSVNRLFAAAPPPATPAAPPEDVMLLREIRDLLQQKG